MSSIERLKSRARRLEEAVIRGDVRGLWALLTRILFGTCRFVQITLREFLDDRLLLRAMALTFATLLSIIPLFAITFSMFQLFGGGEWFMGALRPVLTSNLAPGSGPQTAERLATLLETFGGKTAGGIGLLFLVIMVYGIFSAIESTFNLIWGVSGRDGVFHRLPRYWGLVTIIPILVVGSLALTTYLKALPLVHQAVERVGLAESLVNRLLPGLMVMAGFFLLYRYLPNTRVRSYAAAFGAVTAGLMYEAVKSVFIFYTGRLVQYDVIYGSLVIAPLLMVWINLSWIVVLGGVEICYVTQHYSVLLTKRKHVEFSRPQKDALAYLILAQVTLAFRGKRPPVTIDEWSRRYGVPPGIVSGVVDRLRSGGVLERTGPGGDEILLARDPDYIRVGDIDRILSGEALEEWLWPENEPWMWLKRWLKRRGDPAAHKADSTTLGELVTSLTEVIEGSEGLPEASVGEEKAGSAPSTGRGGR